MASPPTQHYVDPSIAADSGTGTIGDPYGDLQYAFNTITRDTVDGDQINIKAGTAEVLASSLTLATFTIPGNGSPLFIRGYTSVANDGGIGVINSNTFSTWTTKYSYITAIDLEVYNSGSGHLWWVDNYCHLIRCYLHGTTNAGRGAYMSGAYCSVVGCRVEDIANISVYLGTGGLVYNNYVNASSASDAVFAAGSATIVNNIISVSGSSDGIYSNNLGTRIIGNTILSAGGTGKGIAVDSNGTRELIVINNYVEGFSGTGGVGYDYPSASTGQGERWFNAAYNNATNVNATNEHIIPIGTDPEILTASGIAKTGSDTYANRLTYFAPVDEGGMLDGAMQPGGEAG